MNSAPRFAIYVRTSMDEQHELSLELQELRCREAIANKNGIVVGVYADSGKTGWSLERSGFIQLQQDAAQGKFDAVIFWKFDRLARDNTHVTMIKLLLRNEYQLKLYCVEGFSQDEDDSIYTRLMEQMLAVFSAFYSRNLSHDTKRGKRHRAMMGEFNGSVPPLGYVLITQKDINRDKPAGLYIDPRTACLVRRAFRLYATGEYSDGDIANWLMSRPHIQKLRANKRVIDRDFVREMLQNWHYTGRVCHADTQYAGTLGERKRPSRGNREWFEGKHEGFISDELMERCQEVRKGFHHAKKASDGTYLYLVGDILWCARCLENKPHLLDDANYGKMGGTKLESGFYYRCRSLERGYPKCGQRYTKMEPIEAQVIAQLLKLHIPSAYWLQVEEAIQMHIDQEIASHKMQSITDMINRANIRWEDGFINQGEYLRKMNVLESEYQSLTGLDLPKAQDLLDNLSIYWESCHTRATQKAFIERILDRVVVYNDKVVALNFHGGYVMHIKDE